MTTSTDASTVLSEATRPGEGTTLDERAADGDAVADAGGAPDASVAVGGTPSGGGPVAGEGTPVDRTAPLDGSTPEGPPVSWLRIERGHAEPEEIAAISVVLCAQLAGLHALAEEAPVEPPPGRRHPPRRSACWSGCWICG
ncbi:hypothetical protein [Streptomyces platensis]|uniref:hypothetical protein n=1 Tax=Streptomyces platensis TaxID=58346 RepID=UPI00379EC964